MKNTILENRKAELKASEEAKQAAARQAELDAIEPKDIVATMDEVTEGTLHSYRNEEGYACGTNGGAYIQVPDGKGGTIAASSQEEINTIKERMSRGIEGDGLLHEKVVICGMLCDCVGRTEEELEADKKAAENCAKAHGLNILRDVDVAEQLVEADFKKEDLEQIEHAGGTYLLSYEGKYIMDLEGNTVVSLDDIPDSLSKETVKMLLVERLSNR